MKVKVNDKIAVEVKIIKTMDCPAGTAYWTIDYLIDGVCVHSATTGAICGVPNPIAMLDRHYSFSEIHYQDISSPDPRPMGDEAKGREIGFGSYGGRPAWFEKRSNTHRQAIIDAVSQIVE